MRNPYPWFDDCEDENEEFEFEFDPNIVFEPGQSPIPQR